MKMRKRSGNPEPTSTRPKGKERTQWKGTGEEITPAKRSEHARRDRHRSKPAGVILSSKDGGIIAALCPFHTGKAGQWDDVTLRTRAMACEDCQRLTLAINKAAQKKTKEEKDNED